MTFDIMYGPLKNEKTQSSFTPKNSTNFQKIFYESRKVANDRALKHMENYEVTPKFYTDKVFLTKAQLEREFNRQKTDKSPLAHVLFGNSAFMQTPQTSYTA